jgi:hypothetical protein
MCRLEEADTYEELDCYYHITFPTMIPPHTSPNTTPLKPCLGGPVELPWLMDKEKPCKKKSAIRKGPRCFKCNKYGHKHNMCTKHVKKQPVYPSCTTLEEERVPRENRGVYPS